MKQIASISALKSAFEFFHKNPRGKITVDYGTYWNEAQFRQWFFQCLNNKINREAPEFFGTGKDLTDAQRDARIINDWHARRIRHSGTNVLSTPKLKARYPEIDNPTPDY